MLFEILTTLTISSGVGATLFLAIKNAKKNPEEKEVHDILLERQLQRSAQEQLPPPAPSYPLPYHVMRKYLAIANTFPQNMVLYNWLKQHPEHVEAIQLWNDFLKSTVNLNLIFPQEAWEDTQQYLADHHRQFFSVFVPELIQTYDTQHPDPLYHYRIQSICFRTQLQLIDAYEQRNQSRSEQSIQLLEMASQEANGVPLLKEPIQVDASSITKRPPPKPYPMLTREDIENYKI